MLSVDSKNASLIKFNRWVIVILCLFTWAIEIYAAQPWGDNHAYQKFSDYLLFSCFMLWAISPYLVLGIILSFFSRKERALKTITVGILIISLFAVFILIDSIFVHMDAQGGLVVLVLPIYQWPAVFCLILICFFI